VSTLTGDGVTVVPTIAAHVPELLRIRRTPQVRARWGEQEEAPDWPFDYEADVPFTVLLGGADGVVCGFIQFGEENEPAYRHATIDIFMDPAVHGRGLGRDAVRTLARHLIDDRGHHRIEIDPAADNVAAIRCYAAVGFKPVGLTRRSERDADGSGWHDGLLMDLLADELVR
jgi:RimJ/RimL family protein N-acetyltransferase